MFSRHEIISLSLDTFSFFGHRLNSRSKNTQIWVISAPVYEFGEAVGQMRVWVSRG